MDNLFGNAWWLLLLFHNKLPLAAAFWGDGDQPLIKTDNLSNFSGKRTYDFSDRLSGPI